MPQRGMVWRHVIISTRGSWLHGDRRGFRDRWHRKHSSGDCRNPPPPDEHAALARYYSARSSCCVRIPPHLFRVVGDALRTSLTTTGFRVLALSVSVTHAHVLVELAIDYAHTRRIVGCAKSDASRAIRKDFPGNVRSAGGSYKIIKDRPHQLRVFRYITEKQEPNAYTWSIHASRVVAQRTPGQLT